MPNQTQNLKKRTQINFRLDNLEYQKLTISAHAYGLTPSAYAKQLALESRLVTPNFTPKIQHEMLRHLANISGNLNQLAHHANLGQDIDPEKLALIEKEVADLWQQLRK